MLQKRFSVQGLLIFLLCTQFIETKSLENVLNYSELIDDTPEFFSSTQYLLTYIFFWNFIFEVSLGVVIHFKHHPNFITEHAVLNMFAVFGQLVNNLFFFYENPFQNLFFLAEFSLLFLTVSQTFVGVRLNQKLLSPKLVRGIFILRFFHKFVGRVIYLLSKVQIAIYLYFYFNNSQIHQILPIFLLFGLTFITHFSLFLIFNKTDSNFMEITKFKIDEPLNSEFYHDLLKNIELGEIEYEEDDFVLNSGLSQHSNELTTEIVTNKVNWVLIENRVFDITDLRHPKGNYILEAINKKDITRQIYGIKPWRFENKEINYQKQSIHHHSTRTFNFLKNHCIGQIPLCSVISFCGDLQRSTGVSTNTINLYSSDAGKFEKISEKINTWSTKQTHILDENHHIKILFAAKVEGDYFLNLSTYWLNSFGKYFFARKQENELDFFYVTMCLSTRYIHEKVKWYNSFDKQLANQLNNLLTQQTFEIGGIHEILKTNCSEKLQSLIKSSPEMIDGFVPLVFVDKGSGCSFDLNNKFSLHGPIGIGLGFNGSTTKKILIAISDEGSIPFLDFFEFLSQRAIIEVEKPSNPHFIFTKEYLLSFANNPEFFIYWEISDDFIAKSHLLGLSSLKTIGAMQQKVQNKKEVPVNSVVCDIVKRITIVSTKMSSEVGKMVFTNCRGYDFVSIRDLASNQSFGRIDKALVCGNNAFVEKVLKNADLKPEQIELL